VRQAELYTVKIFILNRAWQDVEGFTEKLKERKCFSGAKQSGIQPVKLFF